jgi:uncharacterized protein (DUF934 family)
MPKLIKWRGEDFVWADDRFTSVADEDPIPAGDVILSLKRFMAEGDALLANRAVGVRLEPSENIEDLAYDLPRVAVVALVFPKFTDGRNYSAARLLRERYAYAGEIRAVGEVLREQALHMVRCGIDAFAVTDGSDPEVWAAASRRYHRVYQRAADHRVPIFAERGDDA